MARQKKILDIQEGGYHLVCIQLKDPKAINPYRIYAVISAPGSPLRKRLLIKYGDFMSVLYFLKDFYLEGLNSMPVCDVQEWIRKRTA